MANQIASIIIYGDIHLNSKHYGAHKDYPKESIEYFQKITEVAKEKCATHIIGLGDFTFGRFHTLEYRKAVEDELIKQNTISNGNRYELFGNHDVAGYGMTEYQYYIEKGLLKPSTYLKIGNVNLNMIDYIETKVEDFEESPKTDVVISNNPSDINIILTHNFLKFKDTLIANFGRAIELDEFSKWYGVDYIICGHVHKHYIFKGKIVNKEHTHAYETTVHYLGCMMRPAYRKDLLDENGYILNLRVFDDGSMQYDPIEIPLWPIKEAFNIEVKEKEQKVKEEKEKRLDISDIVQQLNSHERNVGNPEDIINGMTNVAEKYKEKAIKLLKEAQG